MLPPKIRAAGQANPSPGCISPPAILICPKNPLYKTLLNMKQGPRAPHGALYQFNLPKGGSSMKFAMRASALAVAACLAAPAQADFSFSPRFFLYFDNAYQRSSGFDEQNSLLVEADADAEEDLSDFFGTPVDVDSHDAVSASISNQQVYPLFGAAFTADLDSSKRTQITVSALYGKSTTDVATLQTIEQDITVEGFTAQDVITQHVSGKSKAKRLDLELTLQHRLNERFALLGGLRYERITSKGTFDFNSVASNNASNLFELLFGEGDIVIGLNESNGTMTNSVTDNIFSARVGGAAFANLDQRNLVYLNGLLHYTHQSADDVKSRLVVPDLDFDESQDLDIKSESAIGPDFSVGYVHRFTDTIGLDVRYRAIVYFPISGSRDFDDTRVNHGINAGHTFNF
jgi:hypothetical protein